MLLRCVAEDGRGVALPLILAQYIIIIIVNIIAVLLLVLSHFLFQQLRENAVSE